MILSLKRRGFLPPLIIIAVSLALCLAAWVKDTAAKRERILRILSFQSNSYVLTIELADAAREAASDYVSGLDQGLVPTSLAYLVLNDRHTLRDSDGYIIGSGDDMFVELCLLTFQSPLEPHLVLMKGYCSNEKLVDYFINEGLSDDSSAASEITSTHEVKRDVDGTEVRSKIWVSDPDGTIRFRTKFMQPKPVHEPPVSEDFVAVVPYKVRFGDAPDRVFQLSQGRTVYGYVPPPPDLFIDLDINLDPSIPEGAIFNNPDNVITGFAFTHLIETVDEILR